MITLSHITHRYSNKTILNDINIHLTAGDILGVLGINGAGKSTLLKIAAGLIQPLEGQVRWQVETSKKKAKLDYDHKRYLGYAGLPHNFIANLTVQENLYYACKLRGLMYASKRAKEVMQAHQLAEVAERLARNLSKGFAQRLATALAMIHNPKLLILDEPCSGLDPMQQDNLISLLHFEQDSRATIISSHDIEQLQTLCTKIIILHLGVLHEPISQSKSSRFEATFALRLNLDDLDMLATSIEKKQVNEKSVLLEFPSQTYSLVHNTIDQLTALPQNLIEFRRVDRNIQEQFFSIVSQQRCEV